MMKNVITFTVLIFAICPAMAAFKSAPNRFINKSLYENVYPNTLNTYVRQRPNTETADTNASNKTTTGNTTSMSSMGKRRVVKRTTNARAATSTKNTGRRVVPRSNVARNGTSFARNVGRKNSSKQVVARSARQKTASRYNTATTNRTSSTSYGSAISSERCFSDYKECMESYCERPDTAYNRCYCSAKLAQIDSKYQKKIDNLVQQIVRLKYNTDITSEEIKEYWDETVSQYTGDNPWVNIENALNIDWADTESRVRGQNAFSTGHLYCVRNLKSCSWMATNMRDAYRSEIARDCDVYEKSLQQIQTAAESVIESYND